MAISGTRSKKVIALDTAALEWARIGKGFTKRDIARLAGISPVTVWRAFSSGLVGLRVGRLVAEVLGLDLAALWREVPGGGVNGR